MPRRYSDVVSMSTTPEIAVTTTGRYFAPYVEAPPGSVRWLFDDSTSSTATEPVKDFGTAGVHTTVLRFAAGSLRSLNLGFNNGDSAGPGNMPTLANGQPLPEHPQQNVVTLAGLQSASACLVNLAVSLNTNLSALNLTGMSALQYLEAFMSTGLVDVVVDGCTSLVRLCCEGCPLARLDLSGCPNIHDVRDRTGYIVGGVPLFNTWHVPVWGANPRTFQWHLCVGGADADNPAITGLGSLILPNLRELWIWRIPGLTGVLAPVAPNLQNLQAYGCRYSAADLTACPAVNYFDMRSNLLTQAAVDAVLAQLVAHGLAGGYVDLRFNTAPSVAGVDNANILRGRVPAWNVQTD